MHWASAAEQFTKALAAPEPTPGGGAAAAMAGAMGCALALMAIGTTLKRPNMSADLKAALEKGKNQLAGLQSTLQKLARRDADAYAAYISACKLPKDHPSRMQVKQDALWFAASVPVNTATACRQALEAVDILEDKVAAGIVSDIRCARHLLRGAIACSLENIRANLVYIQEPERIKNLTKLLEDYEPNGK